MKTKVNKGVLKTALVLRKVQYAELALKAGRRLNWFKRTFVIGADSKVYFACQHRLQFVEDLLLQVENTLDVEIELDFWETRIAFCKEYFEELEEVLNVR